MIRLKVIPMTDIISGDSTKSAFFQGMSYSLQKKELVRNRKTTTNEICINHGIKADSE